MHDFQNNLGFVDSFRTEAATFKFQLPDLFFCCAFSIFYLNSKNENTARRIDVEIYPVDSFPFPCSLPTSKINIRHYHTKGNILVY